MRHQSRVRLIAILTTGAVACTLPWSLSLPNQTLFAIIGMNVMIAVGLSLLIGFAGQISAGHAAFYALGAYSAGILATRYHWPTLLALGAAPVFTAAAAVVVGIPLLRLRGHYLAFATLAFHLMLLQLAFAWEGFTGGQIGLIGIPPLKLFGWQVASFGSKAALAAIVWAVATVIVLASSNLVDSPAGRGLRAIAAGERTAATLGVGVGVYKLKLFVVAAAYAGLAGGFYCYLLQLVSPDSFSILLSIQFLVMVAVGGMGSIYGSVIGAVAITLLDNELRKFGAIGGLSPTAPRVITLGVYAVILIVVILIAPRGLVPALRRVLPGSRKPVESAVAGASET